MMRPQNLLVLTNSLIAESETDEDTKSALRIPQNRLESTFLEPRNRSKLLRSNQSPSFVRPSDLDLDSNGHSMRRTGRER